MFNFTLCEYVSAVRLDRSYLRITSQEFTTLPLDIVVQAVLSLFAVMWGVLNVAGNLREIPAAAELNNIRWETQRNLPSFYTFNHRGRALAFNYIPSASKSELDNLE
ncbi:unnamed protein product, partial [Iphiclides podalirius]